MKENHLEQACLNWLASLGWHCMAGDAFVPGRRTRALVTFEVIEELIQLAKAIIGGRPPHGLSEEEFAFYQVQATNESAVRELGDPTLRALAQELTD
jgi:hypothetical protein